MVAEAVGGAWGQGTVDPESDEELLQSLGDAWEEPHFEK